MYYILHGDDEFLRAEQIAEFKRQVAEEGLGDLNVSELDGRALELTELINVCNTVPFLASRRLVIVHNLLQREPTPEPEEGAAPPRARRASIVAGLLEYLPHLPAFTRLVLVENRTLPANHALLKACRESKECYQRELKRPNDDQLPGWVERRAAQKGVRIAPDAAGLLAECVHPRSKSRQDDPQPVLRALDAELTKLAGYVGYVGTITADDVRLLVTRVHVDDVFSLVDALGMRQGRLAMRLLQEMLDGGENELALLSMIARQVRLILAAKEHYDAGRRSGSEVAREMRLHSFVADKLLAQAHNLSYAALERAHRLVVETETAIKTGADARLALELLVLQICARSAT